MFTFSEKNGYLDILEKFKYSWGSVAVYSFNPISSCFYIICFQYLFKVCLGTLQLLAFKPMAYVQGGSSKMPGVYEIIDNYFVEEFGNPCTVFFLL